MEGTDYKVRLEIFEGPLDLLLYLIKKDEVDIHDISIERITRQYLAYLDTFRMLNIDLASEFIVMAANLMYIKSRTLLPRQEQPPEEDAEEDDPRWDLIRQLIEYKKFKDAAGFLAIRASRTGRPLRPPTRTPSARRRSRRRLAAVSIFDLIRAFQNVLKRFEEAHDLGDIVDDRFTVNDKIESLLATIPAGDIPQLRCPLRRRHHPRRGHRHLPRLARIDETQPVRGRARPHPRRHRDPPQEPRRGNHPAARRGGSRRHRRARLTTPPPGGAST